MGIEPFLIASTLNTVIGQRLVRRVAERRETYQSTEMETKMIKEVIGGLLPKTTAEVPEISEKRGYGTLPLTTSKNFTLVKGVATGEAPGGYKGRAGLYETIAVDEDIQKLIVARATSGDIMKIAKMKGAVTMRQDGMLKALTGIPEWGYYVAWYKMSGGYYPYSPRPEGPCPPKAGFSPLSMSGEKGTKK